MNNILNIFTVFLLISCNNDNGKNKTSTNNYNPDFHFQKNNKNTIDNNDIYVMFLQGPQQGELLNKIQDYGLKQIESQYMFLFNKNENKIIGHILYSYRIGCRPGNVDIKDDKTLETIKSKIKNTIPIWEIKIKENYQQKGYFKRMFLFFLSHFEQNTLFDLMATSHNKKNMPNKVLINIYKNFGFKIANNVNGMYYFKKSDTIQYKNNNFNKENVKIEVKSK